jgi:tryptophan synthase alpha chain
VAAVFVTSTAPHASAVADIADGVIVGSRVVRASAEGGPAAVSALVAELAEALR